MKEKAPISRKSERDRLEKITSNIGQFIFIPAPYVSDHHDRSLSGSLFLIV